MKINIFIRDWFISSVLTFIIYEFLWNILILHSWDIQEWSIVFFDLFYCSVFVALSLNFGKRLCKINYFKDFTFLRQIYLCTIILVSNMALAALFEFFYEKLLPAETEELYHDGIYLFCFIASMLSSIHNIGHYYHIIAVQKEQLFALKRQTLKNKLDPHFVFNTLSVLTELIYVDQERAEKFCIQFSHIYRHILSVMDNEYISLTESIECVKDYVRLQQYRVEGKIELDIRDFKATKDEMLFPLTLLTLVENAIKHNAVCKSDVLIIRIKREDNEVVVSNNLNPATKKQESLGIGLQTIINQYKFENIPQPRITCNDNIFEVKITIIKDKRHPCIEF